MKKIIIAFAALSVAANAFALDAPKKENFKLYGFIRNYYAFDTRESLAGTEDFFYYLPKDQKLNADGEDMNAVPQFRFAALTSRIGLDFKDYKCGKLTVGAKIETDFYCGLSFSDSKSGYSDKVTGTAQLRMRQAYVTFGMNNWALKAGQAWHPMAADMPEIFDLNTGSPFGPFSRTPQVTFDLGLPKGFGLTFSALWQMQYTSCGPYGSNASYMKYSCIPEFYAGVNYQNNGWLLRLGADVLSIKPRWVVDNKKVTDRITTVSPFFYAQYQKGMFSGKFKTIFAEDGSHLGLNGGYGVKEIDSDGNWYYTPTRNSSSWISLRYGKKLQGILFGGYVKNFGTKENLLADEGSQDLSSRLYFSKNSYSNMNQMWRITPAIVYNLGKLAFGLECEITSVQYGEYVNKTGLNLSGLATTNLHWITNYRVQGLIKFTF